MAANLSHLAYFYCFDHAEADVLRVFQLYADAAAADAFLENPAYRGYLGEVEPLLAGQPEVHPAKPQWSKAAG